MGPATEYRPPSWTGVGFGLLRQVQRNWSVGDFGAGCAEKGETQKKLGNSGTSLYIVLGKSENLNLRDDLDSDPKEHLFVALLVPIS